MDAECRIEPCNEARQIAEQRRCCQRIRVAIRKLSAIARRDSAAQRTQALEERDPYAPLAKRHGGRDADDASADDYDSLAH